MKTPKSLFWRIYPSYLVVILMALALVGLHTSAVMKRYYHEQMTLGLESRANLLRNSVLGRLTPLDEAALDRLCKTAGRHADTRITVVLPSGRVVGDSEEIPARMDNHAGRPEISKAFRGSTGQSIRHSETLSTSMMYVAVPVERQGRTLAVIRTALPLDEIGRKIGGFQRTIFQAGLLVALMAAVIGYAVARRIARPIEEVRKGAERFAKGDFTYAIPPPKSKEMVMLVNTLTQMASELNDRIQTVDRQRGELEAVLSSMQEGVIAFNMDETLINANAAAAGMFNFKPSNAIGRSIQEVIRNPQLHRFVHDALGGKSDTEGEIRLYQEEAERILGTHSSPLRESNGKRIGTLIVFHDITRLRRLETVRREFAANVSHEIKTPLTAIKGFVETLLGGAVDDPEAARRFLRIIEKHADRLTAIIEDLMKLSEIEQKGRNRGIGLKREAMAPVIRNAVEVCRVRADEKKIAVEVDCDEAVVAEINAHFLEQAVVNLVDNALKYSGAGKAVRVRSRLIKDSVEIRIEDEGIGIPGSHLPRLFERFYRVDKSRSRKEGGTGLGLAIVKHIVQAHGGKIDVESTPGKGSTFIIRLPTVGGVNGTDPPECGSAA
ncbi:MAG: ATP-binding protein [Desulfococcus multivorans]|jgi:two-component system phosphate regulon sensor histidine kinase PhoR|nr:ATP-binding protein [Desulfococcus multivorans]